MDQPKLRELPAEVICGLPEEVQHDLHELFFGTYGVTEHEEVRNRMQWYDSFVYWKDTGDTKPIAKLITDGYSIPSEARQLLSHILNGGKRGVKRNHKTYAQRYPKERRKFKCRMIKSDLKSQPKFKYRKAKIWEDINKEVVKIYNEFRNTQPNKADYARATLKSVKEDTAGMSYPFPK